MIAMEFSFTASGGGEAHAESLQASIAAESSLSEKYIKSAPLSTTNKGIAIGSSM